MTSDELRQAYEDRTILVWGRDTRDGAWAYLVRVTRGSDSVMFSCVIEVISNGEMFSAISSELRPATPQDMLRLE